METQSTCLAGTSKDPHYKCKITSHPDNWMPNIQNPYNSEDHMCRFSHVEAMDIEQILFDSELEGRICSLNVRA